MLIQEWNNRTIPARESTHTRVISKNHPCQGVCPYKGLATKISLLGNHLSHINICITSTHRRLQNIPCLRILWSVKRQRVTTAFDCEKCGFDEVQTHLLRVHMQRKHARFTGTCRDCECILDGEHNHKAHFRILFIEDTKVERMLEKDAKIIAMALGFSRITWQKSMSWLPILYEVWFWRSKDPFGASSYVEKAYTIYRHIWGS